MPAEAFTCSQALGCSCFNFVNGIRFKKWFTGLGADIQFNRRLYNYGPIPFNTSAFYIDGRYYINKNKSFFAKTDGGVNLIIEKLPSSSRENYKKLMGYHTAFGIGFKAKLGHEVFYSFDINYLIKQTRFNYNYIGFRNEWQTEKYDVRQYAIILNMGLEFF